MTDLGHPPIVAPEPLPKSEHRERVLVGVMLVAVALASTLWAIVLLRPEPFDPLTFEPQTVEYVNDDGVTIIPTIEGFNGPAIRVGDRVPVRAAYNVDHTDSISVVGTAIVWETEEPRGIRCANDIELIPNEITPGPHISRFENTPNDCVIETTAQLGALQWTIRGLVDVLTDDGESVAWSSEPFWLVPA